MLPIWSYQTVGARHNAPVIFLHGFMGSGANWLPIAHRCADRFYCLLPDLPGHGKNTALALDQPLNFQTVAAGLIDLLAHLELEKVNLVGYSLGGRVALYTAVKFPHKIERLILESANPGLEDAQTRQARAETDEHRAEILLTQGLDTFVEQWYRMELFSSLQKHPGLLETTTISRKQNDPRWMAKVIRELSPGRQPSLWPALERLNMPVLLLAGALDAKYTALVEQMGAKIPRSMVEIVPKAGHNIHLERPAQFVEFVVNFLQLN